MDVPELWSGFLDLVTLGFWMVQVVLEIWTWRLVSLFLNLRNFLREDFLGFSSFSEVGDDRKKGIFQCLISYFLNYLRLFAFFV